VSLLVACAGSQAAPDLPEGAVRRDTAITHEECDTESSGAERIDANGDGKPDIVVVRQGGKELCRAVDLNMDGVVDRWSYLDAAGKLRRQESDYDRDGRIDEIAMFQGGVPVEKHSATTLHHQLDTWHFYDKGRLVRTERDSNGDAVVDQWWEYKSAECPVIHSDVNNDGRPDPGASIDYCKETGFVPPSREAKKTETPRFDTPSETVTEVENSPDGSGEADSNTGASPGKSAPEKKGTTP
jgi:hypothetical protein